nr:phosphatidate cytidylyltransferase [Planococcus glaciei]
MCRAWHAVFRNGLYYTIETREYGLAYIIFALFIVWFTDSGAYFTGRKIGKRKLWLKFRRIRP